MFSIELFLHSVEGSVQLLLACGESVHMVIRADHDDEVDGQIVFVSFGEHRPDLALDADPSDGNSVFLANRDPDSGMVLARYQLEVEGKVLRLDSLSGADDVIELRMLLDAVFPLHRKRKRLVGDFGAAFGTTAGDDGTAGRGRHAGTESGLVGVLHFGRLIGFL